MFLVASVVSAPFFVPLPLLVVVVVVGLILMCWFVLLLDPASTYTTTPHPAFCAMTIGPGPTCLLGRKLGSKVQRKIQTETEIETGTFSLGWAEPNLGLAQHGPISHPSPPVS
eukprot:TRINITY_DN11084_c0_g1_i1.p1 TRINITY_DN11084_c0_g1~~TRINITY_DN11084_c0_g1_i1.p1  ORF type:complete len:113 (-),score=15.12 TRINITY_DN11084_c0_g1_i1:512-850(-)